LSDPHLVLAVGAAAVGLAEYGYRTRGAPYGLDPNAAWLLAEAAVALGALLYAWRAQDRLRAPAVLVLALAFHAGWLLLHRRLSVPADGDPLVYELQGGSLRRGDYPRSEYPPGAVLLFGAEDLAPGRPLSAHKLFMVPFQLLTVGAILALRTRYSAWLAAVAALWPVNTYFWEFRFDLVPTALLALGLLLAYRARWGWSGLALGLGTVVKWTPALAFAALLAWCVVGRRTRPGARLTGGFLAGVLPISVSLLALSAGDLWSAYTQQASRSITGESLWYLPLRFSGTIERVDEFAALPASAPRWADVLATVVQILLVLAVIGVAALARTRTTAVAAATLPPALFLLTNRIFSPQFLVLMLAAWAIAVALLARSRREQLILGAGMMAACLTNEFVYPHVLWERDPTWEACSALTFITSLAVCGWIVMRVLRAPPEPAAGT
jgi:hypothetical protein